MITASASFVMIEGKLSVFSPQDKQKMGLCGDNCLNHNITEYLLTICMPISYLAFGVTLGRSEYSMPYKLYKKCHIDDTTKSLHNIKYFVQELFYSIVICSISV